jgi:ATP-dependent DNA helicase RecG
MRTRYQFVVIGYVVMPEHVHILMNEPKVGSLAVALQALKLSVAVREKQKPFWQSRYYDFNVFSIKKQTEKLRYLHRNPVARGLVKKPEEWAWSSFRHYANGVEGTVEIESFWTGWRREQGTSLQVSEARPGAPGKEIIESIQKLGPGGLEKVSYPEEALHEIVTNAVLHRDYSITADVQIRIFDDRVEIESPGKLAGQVTVSNVLKEQFARNPKIVRLINKFPNPPNKDVGEGLNTAFEAMERLRLKPPIIDEQDNSVLVTLKRERLASPEQLVMEYMDTHDEITNLVARDLTGIRSENSMKEVFYRLRNRRLLEQVPGKLGNKAAWRKVGDKPAPEDFEQPSLLP